MEIRIKNSANTMKGIEFKPLHVNTIISEIKKKVITGIIILEKICTKGMLFSNLLFFIVFNFYSAS